MAVGFGYVYYESEYCWYVEEYCDVSMSYDTEYCIWTEVGEYDACGFEDCVRDEYDVYSGCAA